MAAVSHTESFEAVRLLVEAGADVHAVKKPGEEIMLARAVEAGDRRTVDLLVAYTKSTPRLQKFKCRTTEIYGIKVCLRKLYT